jgi:phosphoribosylamine-glycine ligase
MSITRGFDLTIDWQDVVVFHAGTTKSGSDIMTSGGRVLAVTSYAPNLHEAVRAVYAGVSNISFEGKSYRRDIAHRYVRFLSLPLHFSPRRQGLSGRREMSKLSG